MLGRREIMAKEKIVIIGGGSAYVPGILYSLAHTEEILSGSEVCLMDINPSWLPMMQKLTEKMVSEAGTNLKVTQTTNLEEALNNSTFVLTNFRPGGIESLQMDEEIPNKYNILGQETTGPGGTFFALRSVPQVLELCEKVEKICPEAWVINYVNPTNFVADAIRRKTKVKSVSICDGGGNGLKYSMADFLHVDLGQLRVRAAGINHHTWLIEVHIKGEDGYPLLRKKIQSLSEVGGEGTSELGYYTEFTKFIFEKYGIFPANSYYLYPYFNHHDALTEYRAGEHSLYKMFARDLPEHWKNFEAMAEGKIPIYMDPNKHHTHVGHGDIAVQIITTIATNNTKEFHVNIPNEGCITNLPQGAIVEVPALVDQSGVKPLCMGDVPKGVVGLTSSLINWQELSVDAALTGDKNLVIQALLAHPWVLSMRDAEKMCEKMLSAHANHLPQFKEKK